MTLQTEEKGKGGRLAVGKGRSCSPARRKDKKKSRRWGKKGGKRREKKNLFPARRNHFRMLARGKGEESSLLASTPPGRKRGGEASHAQTSTDVGHRENANTFREKKKRGRYPVLTSIEGGKDKALLRFPSKERDPSISRYKGGLFSPGEEKSTLCLVEKGRKRK